MSERRKVEGTPGIDAEADTASGGAPEKPDHDASPDEVTSDHTTDENDAPLENPSGG